MNGIPVFNALNNRGEDALLAGELDQWGGHCGRADDYHYHLVPEHLANNNAALPLAFALDGFPIYGKQEPDGSKLKKLDECNGHSENDTFYHYHAISSYPYAIGAFRGKVQMDAKARAPENQIIPQAFTKPIRPPGKPLRGAVIQDFSLTAPNEYSLIYQLANQQGKIRYRWNKESVSFFYSYPDGSSDSATYFIRK